MRLNFTKMNGAGNDFVMLDNRELQTSLSGEQIGMLNHSMSFNQLSTFVD